MECVVSRMCVGAAVCVKTRVCVLALSVCAVLECALGRESEFGGNVC